MKGNELIYGKKIDNIDEIINLIETNCKNNKYSIVNETIDVNDGGVSGVVFGNIVEFAPNDTPKCVEKPDVCFLGKDMGFSILKTVYGFLPELNFDDECRKVYLMDIPLFGSMRSMINLNMIQEYNGQIDFQNLSEIKHLV